MAEIPSAGVGLDACAIAATKGPAEKAGEERVGSGVPGKTAPAAEDDLGHQAYMRPTRLVVPASEGAPLGRVARIASGLSEAPLGTTIFIDPRPGEEGLLAWRDVAGEEPDDHQLAYIMEGLLAKVR
jgi:hypothetical protein